jgi:hypothetical protein
VGMVVSSRQRRVSLHGNGAGAFRFAEYAPIAAEGDAVPDSSSSSGGGGDGADVGQVERESTVGAERAVWSDEEAAGESGKPFALQIRSFHFCFIFCFSTMHVLRSNFFLGTANMVLAHMGDGETPTRAWESLERRLANRPQFAAAVPSLSGPTCP